MFVKDVIQLLWKKFSSLHIFSVLGSKPGVPTNDDYSKAIDEMMKRIKDGKPLTRAPKQVRRVGV